MKPPREANHPPRVVVHGDASQETLRLAAQPGAQLKLDARASTDPDRQSLRFNWFVYPEVGNYAGHVVVEGTNSPLASVRVPRDAAGKSITTIEGLARGEQLARSDSAAAAVTNDILHAYSTRKAELDARDEKGRVKSLPPFLISSDTTYIVALRRLPGEVGAMDGFFAVYSERPKAVGTAPGACAICRCCDAASYGLS